MFKFLKRAKFGQVSFSNIKKNIQYQGSGLDFKAYLMNGEKKPLSFWHDITLLGDKRDEYNIVVEIPRFYLAKFEVSKEIQGNPIVQTTRTNKFTGDNELRYYAMFPQFNYGLFPQTYESEYCLEEGFKGDDDPLDAVELGQQIYEIGQQVKVKVLGAYCVLDQGEIDWKILCLNADEAKKKKIHNMTDMERDQPGIQEILKNWFKKIKVYDGKKQNQILYNESAHDPEKAISVINQTHVQWQELVGRVASSGPNYQTKRERFHL